MNTLKSNPLLSCLNKPPDLLVIMCCDIELHGISPKSDIAVLIVIVL